MLGKKYQNLIEEVKRKIEEQNIKVFILPTLSDTATPVSSPEVNGVIISRGLLYGNKQSAYMLCHEAAHLLAGDRSAEYENNDKCREYCESTANIGALFILLRAYTVVYKKYDYVKVMEELYIPRNFKYYVIDILEDYEIAPYEMSIRKPLYSAVKNHYDMYMKGISTFEYYKYASAQIMKLI